MRSTIQKFQKNNYSLVSKKSIIYLGLAFVTLFNAQAETTQVNGLDTNITIAAAVKAEQYQKSLIEAPAVEYKNQAPVEDKTIVNPATLITAATTKSIEEIIAEDKKITESTITNEGTLFFTERSNEEIIAADNQIIDSQVSEVFQPLFIEKSIEDKIAEDNSIIEAQLPTETQVLDFDKINSDSVLFKAVAKKEILGMN